MWKVKSATTDQSAKITKLLSEGWEPFGVVYLGKKGATGSTRHDVIKMYFRLSDTPDKETIITMDNNVVREIFAGIPEEIVSQIAEGISKLTIAQPEQHPKSLEDIADLHKPTDPEPIASRKAEDEDVDVDDNVFDNDPEEEPESEETRDISKPPKGDEFRVVKEAPVPEPTSETSHDQEKSVEMIKQMYENITLLPRGQDGEVRLMAEAKIYIIYEDGTITEEDTGANTSSLTV